MTITSPVLQRVDLLCQQVEPLHDDDAVPDNHGKG